MKWRKVNKQLPTPGDVHIDAALAQLVVGYLQDEQKFAAQMVFPDVPVQKQTDKYYIFDRDDWRRDNMQKRADATESAGMQFRLSNDKYDCDVYALHIDLGNQVRSNADSMLSLDQAAARILAQQKLIRMEKQFVTDYWATGKWGTDKTLVGAEQFNDGNSDPIGVVEDAKEKVLTETGQDANLVVMDYPVWKALKQHPDLIARVDRGQTMGSAQVTMQTLAAIFEVEQIVILKGGETTSKEGAATATRALIGGKNMWVGHRAPAAGQFVPLAGSTFNWTGLENSTMGLTVARWWIQEKKCWRYEIEAAFDMKITGKDLGYFVASAVA